MGRYWSFAHNGDLKEFYPKFAGRFLPVGDTDSEKAFCFILEGLIKKFPQGAPPLSELSNALHELTKELASHGIFNYLLSNGEFMFAHCSTKLASIVREAPFSIANLKDQDMSVDFSALTTDKDRVAVIATNPLTENENWTVHSPGTLLLFVDGKILKEFITVPGPEK